MKRTIVVVLAGICVLILSLSLNCLAEDLEKKQRELRTQIADRIIEKLSSRFPRLSTEQLGEAKIILLRTMDDVRRLSDVEFALQKEDMAHEIKNAVLREKHNENEIDVDKRIARFLLSPQIIPVLEEHLSERQAKECDL